MANCHTLLVRNLSSSLSSNIVEELFKLFGATDVRLMSPNSRMKGCAYVRFSNHSAATEAMKRLHQLEICGKRLVIVYASKDFSAVGEEPCETGTPLIEETKSNILPKDTEYRFSAIAEQFGINYPLNVKHKYLFPPPNPSVVSRISSALINVPKFYWQVLLLMNKMNLPPPFGPTDKAMPLGKDQVLSTTLALETSAIDEVNMSSEESELESEEQSEEMDLKEKSSDLMKLKRKRRKSNEMSKKRRIRSLLTAAAKGENVTSNESGMAPSEVFDVPSIQVQKRIEFKLNVEMEQEHETITDNLEPIITTDNGFGKLVTEKSENVEHQEVDSSEFITFKDLKENRISKEGMDILPVFKNYQIGKPSNKLYIKNLAKQVDEKNLKYIYGLFVDKESLNNEERFSIRLMKEGRMKGQCFITFPSESEAQVALDETNGYLLCDKPIVVQFAKPKS
ncbi:RNA-binding region-containing protein 3 [Chamberlinius hualienensis]